MGSPISVAPSVDSDTGLSEEHRSGGVELDHDCNDNHEGQSKSQDSNGEDNIEHPVRGFDKYIFRALTKRRTPEAIAFIFIWVGLAAHSTVFFEL